MTDDQIIRRNDVYKLLQETADKKSSLGGTSDALDRAQKAYKLATEPTKLDFPLPELAAYRLAHLKLRRKPTEEQLRDIDELLIVAKTSTDPNKNSLGVIPTIYRLAVLHRMSLLAKNEEEKKEYREHIKDTFAQALNLVPAQNAALSDGSFMAPKDPLWIGPIQNPHFNLLELASYFLGEEYQGLEGLGGNRENDWIVPPKNQNAWILVGPNPSISEIHLHQKFAFAELDEQRNHDPDSIVFLLGKDKNISKNISKWKQPRQSDWKDINAGELLILSVVLKNPRISEDELRVQVVDRYISTAEDGRDDTPGQEECSKSRYRQNKRRLREKLSKASDLPKERFFYREKHGYYVPPEVNIYGAVQRSALPSGTQ